MQQKCLVLVVFIFLWGCADDGSSNGPGEEGVFDAQIESLDKAQDVERQLQDAAAQQRQAIEDSTAQ